MEETLPPLERRILEFFREHPHAVETARGIATWIAADAESTQEALDALVVRKWISLHQSPRVSGYALTQEERFLDQIRKTLEGGSP